MCCHCTIKSDKKPLGVIETPSPAYETSILTVEIKRLKLRNSYEPNALLDYSTEVIGATRAKNSTGGVEPPTDRVTTDYSSAELSGVEKFNDVFRSIL